MLSGEENIDRERVITSEDNRLNELICPICFCLLWKARSCASCENLFCMNCIHTWINENSNACPLCRSIYEEKLPSPATRSILSYLSIQCRNISFGCQEILPYNILEQHERIDCKFLTKKCCVCEEIVLVTDIEQHRKFCKPVVIQCALCQRSVKTELFEEHREECLQRYSNLLEFLGEGVFLPPNLTTQTVLSPTPTVDLVGIDRFNQSREKSTLIRSYAMIQLMLSNLLMIHLIILNLFGWGFRNFIDALTISFLHIQSWIRPSIYRTFIFSILFNFTLFILLQSVSDIFIITFIIFSLIIWSSMDSEIKVHQFQMNFNFNEIFVFTILILLLLQISLFLIRFYFAHLPIHLGTICLSFGIFYHSKSSQSSTRISDYFF